MALPKRVKHLITLINERLDVLELNEHQLETRKRCEESFYEFVKEAWTTLENRDFIPGWHVKAMCEHLQAAYDLKIRKLLINLPPRTGKSNIMSVFFPAWCWAKDPGLRFLYTAYAQTLSVRDSVGCRRLIKSEWYQSLWRDRFHLMSDVNNKLRFDNNQSGYRIASSVGGTNTGLGGDFVVCFPYHIKIMTDRGEIKIGEIIENQLDINVLTYNHQEEKQEFKPILKRMTSDTDELLEINFEDGSSLQCTPDHPIFIENKGYKKASSLRTGERCLSY